MLWVALLSRAALAGDPAILSCPGTQPCDGKCISWAELCPTATPAPLVVAPTTSEFCGAGPLPDPDAAAPSPEVKKAAKVMCTAGMILGQGCDYNSPMLRDPPKDPEPPCGGPPTQDPRRTSVRRSGYR